MKKLASLVAFLFISYSAFAQEYPTGLEFSKEKYEQVLESAPILMRSYTSLPSSYSLKAYAPTPGNQGAQPSCVGWASGYGARTIAYAIKNNWRYNTSKINQNTFSPSFVYNQIKFKGDYNCKRGSYIADAMKLIKNNGILKLNQFNYNQKSCTSTPSSYLMKNAKRNTIYSFERLSKWGDQSNSFVRKVKKAISEKNPVVIGMNIKKSFYRAKGYWNTYGSQSIGGHAMVVVGYDDNKYGGAFEILNSWGTLWGNSGYIWVKYSDFKMYTNSTFVMVDNVVKPIVVKDDDNIKDNVVTTSKISGEITLRLGNGKNMIPTLSNEAKRGFGIVKSTKTTYSINQVYTSGTQFRIYLKSKQRGYVYLIGYGSADKSVSKLYPFESYSDFFNYTNSEIAIPNEDYFIEFDNKPGRDILCVLYSKEKLNINSIISKAKYGSGDFVQRIKSALQYKMFKGDDLTFSNDKIAFSASSKSASAKVVPIFIQMNHQ
ncbi:MAG: DUF4384 domain-containing protein [Flavobacteriaceae bacterium]